MTPENLPTSEFQKPKIDQEIEAYIASEDFSPRLSENTVASYSGDFAQFGQFCQSHGITTVGQLTRNDLETWISEMRSRYSPATIARRIASLKGFFEWARAEGVLRLDFTETLPTFKVERPTPKLLTAEQVRTLMELGSKGSGLWDLRDAGLIQVALKTGAKVTEIVSLKVEDVNVDSNANLVTIRFGTPQESGRIIEVDKEAGKTILNYLLARSKKRKLAQNQHLFTNKRGKDLTRQGFWAILKEYGRKIRVLELDPTTLRNTFVANFIGRPEDLAEILGIKKSSAVIIQELVNEQTRPGVLKPKLKFTA